ncbi:DUF4012 domain-containing protein [Cryobacterium glaciale]|uniref:DUF4012 domain-containing protein n=1 Tax=Cryobacterium glaciale TaxID=1259145 RepID=A0A4V3I806_9MICO|nr:DUF4012 domain-containing protein [Cryobacterium glaciale]TFB71828.1 DUF4012 domain-containing protein [Cryobacterium glaciale]
MASAHSAPATPASATPAPAPPERRKPARARTVVGLVVLGLLAVVLFVVAWVGIRGLQAQDALESALPLAAQLQEQVLAGETAAGSATDTAAALADYADTARDRTSDPIWRAVEALPGVGPNLVAVRELAAVVDDVATDAITPLATLAGKLSLDDFKPVDGQLALQPLLDAQQPVQQASSTLSRAAFDVTAIDTSAVLEPVRRAVNRLQKQTIDIAGTLDIMDRAITLLPAMLGADGPRNYILLFQNPAELRSTGGISGALALLHTENGAISLTQQASSASFRHHDEPVLPLSDDIRSIYGDITGEYIQNINLTPDFAETGALAREMWRIEFGVEADGVLSVDPVTLSYLLQATGPITLATGDELTADNAVNLLLSEVYARYDDPAQQDAFFAAAAGAVFDAVKSGRADPATLIDALTQAGREYRVLINSARDDEQAVLADTTLAGGRPLSSDAVQTFGLYLNDATGAKMDVYLDVQTAVGQSVCRLDKRPQFAVQVTMTNTAPADAAATLPPYVTGGGAFGIALGNVNTKVSAYGVPGMLNDGVSRDGVAVPYHPAADSGYPVSSIAIDLAPGESTVLRFDWLGAEPFNGALEVRSTPLISLNETQTLPMTC